MLLPPSNSQTTPETPPPVITNDVEEDNHDIKVAHMGNDPYFGIQIPEVSSDQSSSGTIHTIGLTITIVSDTIEKYGIAKTNGFVDKDNPITWTSEKRSLWVKTSYSTRGMIMWSSCLIIPRLLKGSVVPTLFSAGKARNYSDARIMQEGREKKEKALRISSTEAEDIAFSGLWFCCCASNPLDEHHSLTDFWL
ncbi:hypothetical protein Tco_0778754 [Tanacetum coccineum]